MSKFSDLLTALGGVLGATLYPEQETLCKIKIKDGPSVQLEFDESSDRVFLISLLAELPPGKFREEALLTALKANYEDTSLGSFAYADAKQMLTLQLFLPSSTPAPLLATLLQQFVEKGNIWKTAIVQGSVSSLSPSGSSDLPSPMNFK